MTPTLNSSIHGPADVRHEENPIAIPDIAGKALTVAGPVDPGTLGETLMHEHTFIDIRRPAHSRHPGWDSPASREPLALHNLAHARLGGLTADNNFICELDLLRDEVLEFKYAGGGTIVDVSNLGLGRDPRSLLRLSRASGLHFVMGAGWYETHFHPVDMDDLTVEQMTDTIVRDIAVGVEGTTIRSGVIGEVGIEGNPLKANELKSVRASARASRLTGAPISFHVGGFREEKFDVLDILVEEGVDMTSVVMGHSNGLAVDLPFARRVLERGVFIEFDYLGAPGSPAGYLGPRNDFKVGEGLIALVEEGYANRIVLGHDVCTKLQLKNYGGTGYSYISDHFLPALRRRGLSEEAVYTMMVENPRRALTFAPPRPLVG